jgi:hypothetical protein
LVRPIRTVSLKAADAAAPACLKISARST